MVQPTRQLARLVLIGLALVVTGCAGTKPSEQKPVAPNAPVAEKPKREAPIPKPSPAEMHRTPVGDYAASRISGDFAGNADAERFVDHVSKTHGFPREYLNGLLSQAERKDWTLRYLGRERSAKGPRPGSWSRYRAKFLTERHIAEGAQFWREHAATLERAHGQFGVPPEYILGIMGVETVYGGNVGTHRVIDALATLAFNFPRRSEYFTGELENFLLMARDEAIDPSTPVGSYAGAMGLGQFMPTSFRRWAVDFNGDGTKDLWSSEDAIGSIANYFVAHGWKAREPVVVRAKARGSEVKQLESGYDTAYSLADLIRSGVHPVAPIADDSGLRLIRLRARTGDEYWLGLDNFYTITRYNHSSYYAMAVHQLAQAIKERHLESIMAER